MSGWFGEDWGAPLCKSSKKVKAPIGEKCSECGQDIVEGHNGHALPYISDVGTQVIYYHHWCFMMNIIGPEMLLEVFQNNPESFNPVGVMSYNPPGTAMPCGCELSWAGLSYCKSHEYHQEHGHAV